MVLVVLEEKQNNERSHSDINDRFAITVRAF